MRPGGQKAFSLIRFQSWKAAVLRCGQADMAFYILPALMILLAAGTVSQKYIGLYAAQQLYFSSWIIWAGPVPLPGGMALIALFALSLAIKFFGRSAWKKNKIGIVLSHFGAFVLIFGGVLSALGASEGYMIIQEGQKTPYVYDYNARELSVFQEKDGKASYLEHKFGFEDAVPGQVLSWPGAPFQIEILQSCRNCKISKRQDAPQFDKDTVFHGMARFMSFSAAQESIRPEENIAGVTFRVTGADESSGGVYVAFEGMPKPETVTAGGRKFQIVFGKVQRELPFMLGLRDFKRENHPGTAMASAYSSDVVVLDGSGSWPVTISMNEPLRYRGYTFYQSSFAETDEREATILSVVQNKGRLFPYTGTFLIAAGLLLHLFFVWKGRSGS